MSSAVRTEEWYSRSDIKQTEEKSALKWSNFKDPNLRSWFKRLSCQNFTRWHNLWTAPKDIRFLMIFLRQHEKYLIISFVNLIVRRVFKIQGQVYLIIRSVCIGLFNTEVLLIKKTIFENWCWASSNLPLPCGFRIYHIDCGWAWVQSFLISSFLATRYLVSREDYLS